MNAIAEPRLDADAYNKTDIFVAKYFDVDPQTVRGWRKRGIGPPYKKIAGHLVRYQLSSLIKWAEEQRGSVE